MGPVFDQVLVEIRVIGGGGAGGHGASGTAGGGGGSGGLEQICTRSLRRTFTVVIGAAGVAAGNATDPYLASLRGGNTSITTTQGVTEAGGPVVTVATAVIAGVRMAWMAFSAPLAVAAVQDTAVQVVVVSALTATTVAVETPAYFQSTAKYMPPVAVAVAMGTEMDQMALLISLQLIQPTPQPLVVTPEAGKSI